MQTIRSVIEYLDKQDFYCPTLSIFEFDGPLFFQLK